jgi:EAL domain-containing protein (putative c-di-GMP-specific phosphodiesterase class I)
LWVASLAFAALAIGGGPWHPLVALLVLVPIALWLQRGPADWHRWRTLTLAYPLWRALRSRELVLFFQPKAEVVGGRVRSVEALVRWRHRRRGLLLPADFLPAIQDGLLERSFNRFVLREAFEYAARWQADGRPLRISVNVSPGYVIGGDLVPYLRRLLAGTEVDRRLLRIEVPEFALRPRDVSRFNAVICSIKELGISVSIDDFGMGQSSLARLVELPIEELKIDRKFVSGMACDHKADRVVHTAIDLAHALGLVVVAEGVETSEQWIQLTAWGCDLVQGFRIQRPVPAHELWGWLDQTGRNTEVGSRSRRFDRQEFGDAEDAEQRPA